jgi:hypothetical protein
MLRGTTLSELSGSTRLDEPMRTMIAVVRLVPLVTSLIFAAMAFDLARILITHSGVGAFEWVVGLAGVVALVLGAVHFSRRAMRVA